MTTKQIAEISRVIAGYFEKEPADGEWRNGLGRLSREQFWFRHWDGSEFNARPITDPEITLRLLKWLIEEYDLEQAFDLISQTQPAIDEGTVDVLECAIALAVCRALSLEVGE